MFEHVVDRSPIVNIPLSAKYIKSFAYPTFKERIPTIVQGIIDYLQNKDEVRERHGQVALAEVDVLITKLQNLKISMQSDRPLDMIQGNGVFSHEVSVYNKLLQVKTMENNGNPPTWFQTEWLFAECYLYFKLFEIFHVSEPFKNFDPFLKSKVDTFQGSKGAISFLSEWSHQIREKYKTDLSKEKQKELFVFYFKCALWGNKADLSLSVGQAVSVSDNVLHEIDSMDKNILINDIDQVYDVLKEGSGVIDIILDNAGYELFNDLCLADFLVWSGLADKIIFHGKEIPWFVSDVTPADFDMQFDLMESNIDGEHGRENVRCWKNYLENNKWIMRAESFWVLPYDYSKMELTDPALYCELAKSKLVIFKGDLNYRKLMGDIYWEPTTSFRAALRGFAPTNVLALRTIKADTVCGLPPGTFEEFNKKEPNWLTTGKYAFVQFLQTS